MSVLKQNAPDRDDLVGPRLGSGRTKFFSTDRNPPGVVTALSVHIVVVRPQISKSAMG
jgi:hypothetical protein